MLQVEFQKDSLIFHLKRTQKFWALKSTLKIPLASIKGVSTEKVKMPWIVVRVGTHIPKVFMAGTFWTKEGKIFYYVRDASKCITLELKDHNHDLAVIEVEARGDVAEQLRKKLN